MKNLGEKPEVREAFCPQIPHCESDSRGEGPGMILYELLMGTTPLTKQRVKEPALAEALPVP